jgi:hypothetical protein
MEKSLLLSEPSPNINSVAIQVLGYSTKDTLDKGRPANDIRHAATLAHKSVQQGLPLVGCDGVAGSVHCRRR